MKIRSLLLLIFFIFFSKISLSHEKSIVYIDLNKIMNNSIAGKSITSQLENNHKKNISKFKNIEEELKKEESEIISQKNVITKESVSFTIETFSTYLSIILNSLMHNQK